MSLKNSLLLIASAAALLPTLTMGVAHLPWNITNADGLIVSDLTDITFPFSIADSPHKRGYYFAQQFSFYYPSHIGYTGLQPRPDVDGKPLIRAVFSSFINGTTFNDSNCTPGADGGPGVSCGVEFSAPYGNGFEIEVIKVQGTTWKGTVIDTTAHKSVHIGSWTLPANIGGIMDGRQTGFVEYYLQNDCPTLPHTSVVFGVPKTTRSDVVGHLGVPNEQGNCIGKIAFESHRTVDGEVEISAGFT